VAEVSGNTAKSISTSCQCPQCGNTNLGSSTAIEVGHSFLLGTKYTKSLKVTYIGQHGKPILMEMGCYGIGMTRLLAASIEVLSKEEEIRWPFCIAPYYFAILPPKAGSKEEVAGLPIAEKLSIHLNKLLPGEVLIDDRTDLTIGKRFKDIQKLGIPYILILGKSVVEDRTIELYDTNAGTQQFFQLSEIFNYLYDLKSKWKLL